MSAWTRLAMSSRVARTSSSGRSLGSGSSQFDVALAGDDGALVPAAHRDDDVGSLGKLAGEGLWGAVREVDPQFAHHLDGGRMHTVAWGGVGGQGSVPAGGSLITSG